MPDSLQDLLNTDREASTFFQSLPMFAQDQILKNANQIRNREELSALAHNVTHDAMLLDQYKPMLEDETDSDIDLM